MRLSDLQHKDIISMYDGKKIGNIIDININEHGHIIGIIVEPNKKFFRILSTREEAEIKWSDIAKIGEDVILIKKDF
ncbi:MAG: YlmC/YmxH family sporulation protein [Bacilli bacterium]|jgi:YlmC/YmxH family sporulation protein|nr:YlmC/YmxH family sporulation protein [Bacilli bacterium]